MVDPLIYDDKSVKHSLDFNEVMRIQLSIELNKVNNMLSIIYNDGSLKLQIGTKKYDIKSFTDKTILIDYLGEEITITLEDTLHLKYLFNIIILQKKV